MQDWIRILKNAWIVTDYRTYETFVDIGNNSNSVYVNLKFTNQVSPDSLPNLRRSAKCNALTLLNVFNRQRPEFNDIVVNEQIVNSI